MEDPQRHHSPDGDFQGQAVGVTPAMSSSVQNPENLRGLVRSLPFLVVLLATGCGPNIEVGSPLIAAENNADPSNAQVDACPPGTWFQPGLVGDGAFHFQGQGPGFMAQLVDQKSLPIVANVEGQVSDQFEVSSAAGKIDTDGWFVAQAKVNYFKVVASTLEGKPITICGIDHDGMPE